MAKILSLFKNNRAQGNVRRVDMCSLVSFNRAMGEFINNSQSLLARMDTLIKATEGAWHDETGREFLESFRNVASDIAPINDELERRKENIDLQIAKLQEYYDN